MQDIVRFWLLPVGLICGCGDGATNAPGDGGSDAEPDAFVFVPGNHIDNPAPSPGGGLGSGAINGELNIFVIDGLTEEPIEGAEVRVGDATASSPLEGVTDADGFVLFREEGLAGAQTLTVSAEDHATSTWVGANGALVTIPLDPPELPTPPTATVSGTIPGWEDIPLGSGEYLFGLIAYSTSDDEDDVVDQGGMDNVCYLIPGLADGPCNWTLITRTGPLAIYALVFLADDSGTPFDFNDDTYVPFGYGLARDYNLAEDETLVDEELPLLADMDLVTTQVTYGTLPTGLLEVSWLAMLDLGDEGNAALPALPGNDTLDVPALIGGLASDSYRLIAFAQPATDVDAPQSAILHRTTDVDGMVDLGSWLSMPYNLAADAGTYSFMPAASATIHAVEFTDNPDGTRLWNVLLLDGSTSFELPDLGSDPFSGDTDMTARAFVLPGFDPTEFALHGLFDQIERMSADRLTFTP